MHGYILVYRILNSYLKFDALGEKECEQARFNIMIGERDYDRV